MASSSIPAMEVENQNKTNYPNWLELPRDITENILQRLDIISMLASACKVCPLWWNICKSPHMWCTIRMTNHGYNSVKICRNAVDLSCGQLEEIAIEYFATDDLLAYVADCGGQLRRMRLAVCNRLSEKGFIEAVKKLPLLEELDISFNKNLSKDSLEAIGQCCPFLKSLKYRMLVEERSSWNDEAFVIAKTMPGLQHLKISGNVLDNDGLVAILDRCCLLKSLNLQQCLYLNLSESLKKRCREQIKYLELPLLDYFSFEYQDILFDIR